MKRLRPNFPHYLAWWGGTWLLLVLLTQLPKWYDITRSRGWDPLNGLMMGALELLCALFWAALSRLVQWIILGLLSLLGMPCLFQRRSDAGLWLCATGAVLLAVLECLMLGVPLGLLNKGMSAHPFHHDLGDPVISAGSTLVETAGIMLAFPVACLVAGCSVGRSRSPRQSN